MANGISLPFICTAKQFACPFFASLSFIIHHPRMNEEERCLGLWLAIQCANNSSFSCSYSYEQIAYALNKDCEKVHRLLTRLRVMGFLIANLPIHYQKLTPEMVKREYLLKLVLPSNNMLNDRIENISLFPAGAKRIKINLLKHRNINEFKDD